MFLIASIKSCTVTFLEGSNAPLTVVLLGYADFILATNDAPSKYAPLAPVVFLRYLASLS